MVEINLSDTLLDGIWSSIRRGMASYSSGVKSFFTDYVPGKVYDIWNQAISFAITSNQILGIDTSKIAGTDIQEIDYVKMKTLEDSSRMTNIYKMTTRIFCFENQDNNQISNFNCVRGKT